MARPHVTMHMTSSIDGRIVFKTWPSDFGREIGELYEQIHRQVKGDAWIVGRVSMGEFSIGEPKPIAAAEVYPRATWKAPGLGAGPYAVAVDPSSRLHLNRERANGDSIILILTESAPEDHLAELRRDGISYIFAGRAMVDLNLALDKLRSEFGVERLLLEGGGGINGSFLALDLIDEISLLVVPLADGTPGPTSLTRDFAPAVRLSLVGCDRLTGDILHVRYRVQR